MPTAAPPAPSPRPPLHPPPPAFGGGMKHSDSSASLADAPEAVAGGGVRDVTVPGQTLSRTRPLRSVEEAGSAPIIWTPYTNRGTAFTQRQREALGLEGLLPPRVETLADQAARVMAQLRCECAGPFERYSRLSWLASTNVTLFYYVVLHHLDFCAPIIYTPTVGEACQKFSGHYRGPQGLFVDAVTARHRFGACLANWPNHNVQIVVVTDGSRILGLGDLGIGGVGVRRVGKKRDTWLNKVGVCVPTDSGPSFPSLLTPRSPSAKSSSTSPAAASTRSTRSPSCWTRAPTTRASSPTPTTWACASPG